MSDEILVVTTESIPGYKVKKVLGVVSGSVVRARHIGKDILASFRNITGGEIKEYTELLAQSRDEALRRMLKKAKELGANAILGVRFGTSSVAQGAAEVFAYGTAAVVEKEIE